MKKVYLAASLLLLLNSTYLLAADAQAPQATIGLSNLKSILEHNPHPINTLDPKHSATLIYPAYKKNAIQRGASEANAIELEFDKNEILSAIRLIHFEPNIKN